MPMQIPIQTASLKNEFVRATNAKYWNKKIAIDQPGETMFLSASEAVREGRSKRACGCALRSPLTYVVDNLAFSAEQFPEMHVQWSTNEKVAYEVCYGCAMAGVRAIVPIKNVGMNCRVADRGCIAGGRNAGPQADCGDGRWRDPRKAYGADLPSESAKENDLPLASCQKRSGGFCCWPCSAASSWRIYFIGANNPKEDERMEEHLARYYELKETQKQVEEELGALRSKLLESCQDAASFEAGAYKLTIAYQERREYNDDRLYNSLPDPSLWRLVSKADAGKIGSLLKLNILHERVLAGTYESKKVPVLRIQKR